RTTSGAGDRSGEGKESAGVVRRSVSRSHSGRNRNSEDVLQNGGAARRDARLRWTGFRSTTLLLRAAAPGTRGTGSAGRAADTVGARSGTEAVRAGAVRAAGEHRESLARGGVGESGDFFLSDDDGRTA